MSCSFVPMAESLAQIRSAATLQPKTGGRPFPTVLVLALGGLMLAAVGLSGLGVIAVRR